MADIPLSNVAGGSLIPRIPPATGYVVPNSNDAYRCGFDNNGDSIELPVNVTGTLVYYDSAGNQVTDGAWSGGGVSVSEFVSAGATGMEGFTHFYMNDDGTLLYVIGYDTTPSTIFTCTINKLGVISVLGSFTPAVIPNSSFRWQAGGYGLGLVNDGTNFTFYTQGVSSGAVGKVVFNASTGALVSEESIGVGILSWVYETPNGVGVGGFTGTDAIFLHVRTAAKGQRRVYVSPETGIFNGGTTTDIMMWRGFITANTNINAQAFLKADFDTFVDNVAKFVGIL